MNRPFKSAMMDNTGSVIDVFCDASMFTKSGVTYSCSGAHSPQNPCTYKLCVNRDSTNNQGEAIALYLAISLALELAIPGKTINVFSDSKISVLGIRDWIFSWKYKDGMYFNSSNQVVRNQGVLLTCVRAILDSGVEVNLYHQKGHVNLNNDHDIKNAKIVFRDSNLESIDDAQLSYISSNNDYIDKLTRNFLQMFLEGKKDLTITAPIPAINFIPTLQELSIYRRLINSKI